MLTFLKNGNLFEYVESIDRDTNDINSSNDETLVISHHNIFNNTKYFF